MPEESKIIVPGSGTGSRIISSKMPLPEPLPLLLTSQVSVALVIPEP